MGFLCSVNVYAFIPMMLFFIIKNCEKLSKWVYIGMGGVFVFET